MKRKILTISALVCALFCALGLIACGNSGGGATDIRLNKPEIMLNVGETETLIATVTSNGDSKQVIEWSSSDLTVATVDDNGKVYAVARGVAWVTATCGDASATCTVTVKATQGIEQITINEHSLGLIIGDQATLTASYAPFDAVGTIGWRSSNESVASVDADGKVTAKAVGSAQITAYASNGVSDVCVVEVYEPEPVRVNRVRLRNEHYFMSVGDEITLSVTVEPAEAAELYPVTFELDTAYAAYDDDSATFDENGKVTAVKDGNTHIKVTCGDQITGCAIRVNSGTPGLYFDTYDDHVVVRGIDRIVNASEVVIPSTYKGLPVTEIAESAFGGHNEIESVSIPRGVTRIIRRAFDRCVNLHTITISGDVRMDSYDSSVFNGCESLRNIVYTEGVTYVDLTLFENFNYVESLTDEMTITVPNSVTEFIGSLNGHNIKSTLYNGVKYLGNETNPHLVLFGAEGSLTIDSDDFIHPDTKFIGERALYSDPYRSVTFECTEITIPDGVLSIGRYAFEESSTDAKISAVHIPQSVVSIGAAAFDFANLLTITVAEGNQNYFVQSGILYDKAKTQFVKIPSKLGGDIVIPSGITTITSNLFRNKALITSIVIPDSVTSIESGAFSGCSGLQKMAVPFVGGSLDAAYYPSSGDADRASAHFGYIFGARVVVSSNSDGLPNNRDHVPASLKEVTVTKAIGTQSYAFYGCNNIEKITFTGDDKTSGEAIGYSSFTQCVSLKTLILAHGVSTIDAHAFDLCSSLTALVLPDSVTDIINYEGTSRLRVYYTGREWPFTTTLSAATHYVNTEWEYVDGVPTVRR